MDRPAHTRQASRLSRLAVVIIALLTAALACNLEIQDETATTLGITPSPGQAARPEVIIVAPAESTTISRGQNVEVQARATSPQGVTLVELRANGIVVDSQVPAEESSPVQLDALLDYKAEQPGAITLSVIAYSNNIAGQPAERMITVVDELSPGTGGASTGQTLSPIATQIPYNPQCRARVNTALNFRRGPGTEYAVILTFNAGDEPFITGYTDRTDGRWWQVTWAGSSGWIKESYTTQLGDCGAVRPAAVPATPTPVPSNTPPPTKPGTTSTPTLPDLRLTRLEGASSLQLGIDGTSRAVYQIDVTNLGGRPTSQFIMSVLLPDGSIQNYDVPGLNPAQTVNLPSGGLQVTFTTPGVKRLLITVDSTNVVQESDEGNNQAYIDITVNPGPATAVPTNPPAPTAVPTNPPAPTDVPPPTNAPSQPSAPSNSGSTDNSGSDTSNGGSVPVVNNPSQPITAANASQIDQLGALVGHNSQVSGLSAAPGQVVLASSGWDGTVRLWDVAAGAETALLTGHQDRVTAVAFGSPTLLGSASWDGTIILWDITSKTAVSTLSHGTEIDAVAFSPDGSRVVSGGRNPAAGGGLAGLAIVWDVATGAPLGQIETFGPVTGVALIDNDTLALATAAQDCGTLGGELSLYSVNSGDLIREYEGHGANLTALTVTASRGQIAAGGLAGGCSGAATVWVFDTITGMSQATLDLGGSQDVTALAFSPTTNIIASASADGTTRLWDLGANAQIGVLSGHNSAVESVAFDSTGLWLASGGADSIIQLWGVR